MKKILIVLLSLVLTSSAFGSTTADIDYTLVSGGLTEITVNPSDTFYVDISVDLASGGDAEWLIDTGELTVTIQGNASFIENEDLTYLNEYDVWYGATLNYAYVDSKTLRVRLGTLALSPGDRYTDAWLEARFMPEIVIDHIGIHCDDEGTVTVAVTPYDGTGDAPQWGSTRISADALPGPYTQQADQEALGGVLTVHQIPEPMTVALLGLGALLLRRRK